MQEAFGRAKYGEGEAGVVYKNVHTTVSRGGNVIAGGFFLEGMLAITNPIMAGVSTVLLYTGLQMMNEATNEHEMSTKQQKNPLQVMKKWGLILGAKSVPLALTALSTAAISTPKIAEHFADTEAKRVHTEFVSRQPSITLDPTTNQYVNNELDQNGNPKTLPTMYQEYNMAKQDATTLENQLSGDDITIQTYQREMEGLGSIQTPREPIKTRIDRLKKEIGVDSSKNNELEANFKSMTPLLSFCVSTYQKQKVLKQMTRSLKLKQKSYLKDLTTIMN
jgi:MarR-like DNA-binding transcriptional regulator SgrR of sgrS sRNA